MRFISTIALKLGGVRKKKLLFEAEWLSKQQAQLKNEQKRKSNEALISDTIKGNYWTDLRMLSCTHLRKLQMSGE